MAEPIRLPLEEVYQKLKSGKVILVCAYEDETKFKKMQLQGAISFNEFKPLLFQKIRNSSSIEADPMRRALPVMQRNISKWDTRI